MVHDNRVTVLLTASDEADCMSGDIMGYLRNGRLLVEDSPSVLLQLYNVSTISKLLYCVSVADHHIPADKRWSLPASESAFSIVSGGFTLTTSDAAVAGGAAAETTDRRETNNGNVSTMRSDGEHKKFPRSHQHQPLFLRLFFRRKLVRARQRSKCVRLRSILQLLSLALARGYMSQLAYLLVPILLVTFYYYSVKNHLGIDLGVGKHIVC